MLRISLILFGCTVASSVTPCSSPVPVTSAQRNVTFHVKPQIVKSPTTQCGLRFYPRNSSKWMSCSWHLQFDQNQTVVINNVLFEKGNTSSCLKWTDWPKGYPPCVLIVIKTSPPQIAVFARKDSCVIHGCNVTKLTRPVQLLLVNVTSNSSHLMQYDVIKQDNCTHTEPTPTTSSPPTEQSNAALISAVVVAALVLLLLVIISWVVIRRRRRGKTQVGNSFNDSGGGNATFVTDCKPAAAASEPERQVTYVNLQRNEAKNVGSSLEEQVYANTENEENHCNDIYLQPTPNEENPVYMNMHFTR